MPFSFMMGVDLQDSFMVAKLIGYKTFFNEFVAYEQLSKLINLRKEAGPKFVNGVQQYMSVSQYFDFQYIFHHIYIYTFIRQLLVPLCVRYHARHFRYTRKQNRPKTLRFFEVHSTS